MNRSLSILVAIIVVIIAAGIFFLAGSEDGEEEPPPEPIALLTEAADKITAADTFRLEAIHSGADYLVDVYLGADPARVAFRRATGQYVAESQLQAAVSVLAFGLPLTIDVFASGPNQWVRLPATNWFDSDFAPGFNPGNLVSMDSGFRAALSALTQLEYRGMETLEDGTGVYHLSGMADGEVVTDLLVGMIETEGQVPVEVYIDRSTGYPVRLQITQPETDPDDPTTWTIDVYDINAEPDLNPPEDAVES